MGRRQWGFLVLAGAVIVALVFSGVQPRRVAGAAHAEPVPGRPDLGDCLLESPTTGGGTATGAKRSFRLGSAANGGCAAAHYGEIVQLMLSGGTGSDVGCGRADGYLGWTPLPRGDFNWINWFSLDSTVVPLGPSQRQRAAGQNWAACAALPDGNPGDSYTGSVRNVYAGGRLPSAFGRCSISLNPNRFDKVRCSEPHGYEILSVATVVDPGETQDDVDRSCAAIVDKLTGITSSSTKAQLKVETLMYHFVNGGEAAPGLQESGDGAGGEAVCGVSGVGGRSFVGSLFGLGSNPIPWFN